MTTFGIAVGRSDGQSASRIERQHDNNVVGQKTDDGPRPSESIKRCNPKSMAARLSSSMLSYEQKGTQQIFGMGIIPPEGRPQRAGLMFTHNNNTCLKVEGKEREPFMLLLSID